MSKNCPLSPLLLAFIFGGCAAVDTSVLESPVHEGLTYSLPTTVYEVSLRRVIQEDQGVIGNVVLTVTPKRVATPGIQLALRSDNNPLFDRHHTVSFSNGLLSAVGLDDTGKLSETIVAGAESIAAVQSGGTSTLGNGNEADFVPKGRLPLSYVNDGPSSAEIDEFIKLIPADGLTIDVAPGQITAPIFIPGTNRALYLCVTPPTFDGAPLDTTEIKNAIARYEIEQYGLNRYTENRPIDANGIITKTLSSGKFEASLHLSKEALKQYRAGEYNRLQATPAASQNDATQAQFQADIDARTALLSDLTDEISMHQLRIKAVKEEIAAAQEFNTKAESSIEEEATKLSEAILVANAADIASHAYQLKIIIDKSYRRSIRGLEKDDSFPKDYVDLSGSLVKMAAIKAGDQIPSRLDLETQLTRFAVGNDRLFSAYMIKRTSQVASIRATLTPLRNDMSAGLIAVSASRKDKLEALTKFSENLNALGAAKARSDAKLRDDFEIFKKVQTVELIDDTKIAIIPTYRSALGKSATTLTIKDGILEKFEAEHPSEAVELVSIPKKVVKAIIDVPTDIFKSKTAQRQEELNLRTKELELFEKESDLRKTIKEEAKPIDPATETFFVPKRSNNALNAAGSVTPSRLPVMSSPGSPPTTSDKEKEKEKEKH